MRKIMHYSTVLLVLTFLSACARKMDFTRSVIVPGAEGRVKIKKDRNNNYAIDVFVLHLPPAKNLQPPKQTYVVWMETKEEGIKSIGQLKSSSGLISRTFKASLSSVTPFKPAGFIITAEEDGDVQHPGPQTVLVTEK